VPTDASAGTLDAAMSKGPKHPKHSRHLGRTDDRSERYHNRVARQYDAIYDDAYWRFHDEVTWRAVKPFLPRDLSAVCLDLGCGTGKWGLKLLKSGYATTFLDHSPGMIGKVQEKLAEMGARGAKATAVVGDIVDMPMLEGGRFMLSLAMGDPLSICSDPARAAGEFFRTLAPGGVIVATADNKLAALDHFMEEGDLDALEKFARTGRTHWLTSDEREQFETTTFTPASLRKLFERAGFEVISVVGKTVLPVRKYRAMLEDRDSFDRLLKLEQELSKLEDAAAAAGHLQITARRPASVAD
jgi:ubiquinone/menaquinone biosynthesis C-methylase UbiE